MSNDIWRIAINIEMEPYEEALSVIKGDLLTVEQRKQEFTFNSELKLDTITSVNADAIANLSGIIRDDMIKSHDKFQEITRDILWLNLTIHGQSVLFMTIRQLELAVLQLTHQLDELMDAIQCIIMGKLPYTIF